MQVKTIVNTQYALLPSTDPHHFVYCAGKQVGRRVVTYMQQQQQLQQAIH